MSPHISTQIELISKIKKNRDSYCYIVDETQFFSEKIIEEIKKDFLRKVTTENYFVFYAKNLKLDQMLETLMTGSLFSPRKLIVCKEAEYLTTSQIESLFQFLSQKDITDISLVFTALKKSSHMLYRHSQRVKTLFEFKKPYDSQLPHWIQWIADTQQRKIEPKAVLLIAEKVGTELIQIQKEMEKVILYIGDKNTITEEDVRVLLCSTRAHSVFELTDAIGNKNKAKAIYILHKMLEEGESQVFIFSMILRFLRNIWKAVEWKEVMSETEVQRELHIHPFFWNEFRRQRDLFLKAPFEKYWSKAQETDKILKTTTTDGGGLLTEFAYSLSS